VKCFDLRAEIKGCFLAIILSSTRDLLDGLQQRYTCDWLFWVLDDFNPVRDGRGQGDFRPADGMLGGSLYRQSLLTSGLIPTYPMRVEFA
jgi:hypothetical protein